MGRGGGATSSAGKVTFDGPMPETVNRCIRHCIPFFAVSSCASKLGLFGRGRVYEQCFTALNVVGERHKV